MARVRAIGWLFDGELIGAVCWLIAISTLVAILLTGMVRRVDDPSGVVPAPSFWEPLNFSRAIEIQIRPDLGPFGIEVRKIGRDEEIVVYDHTP